MNIRQYYKNKGFLHKIEDKQLIEELLENDFTLKQKSDDACLLYVMEWERR